MKYELIQTYPGYETLGTIHCSENKTPEWKGTNFYDAHPKYWKKVEEVDYEIMSVIGKDGAIVKKEFYTFPECFQTLIKASETFKIHSVKRLSDGEVFTIGDFTTKGVIHKFEINPSHLSVSVGDQKTLLRTFDKIKKVPLFTTEDGVDVFAGDAYYVVSEIFEIHFFTAIKGHYTFRDNVFSTKEKAEEYILLNKTCLSLNDLLSVWGDTENIKHFKVSPLFKDFKKLAKSKL